MAMSYCKMLTVRRGLQSFQKSYSNLTSSSTTKSSNAIQANVQANNLIINQKKDNHLITDEGGEKRMTYELPKEPPRMERYMASELFTLDYNIVAKMLSTLNAVQFTPYGVKKAWNEFQYNLLLQSQAYVKERAEFLGPELATAYFVCYRGGKVRFYGEKEWTVKDPKSYVMENIPNIYVDFYKVEAVDCSKMEILYEGLENIKLIENLKWLSVESCPYIDDWCLDRIAGEYHHSLEYLNIKDCALVTERGIASLTQMKKLKTLVIGGHPKAKNLELVCLMLEDVLPDVTIKGIIYCDESLLTKSTAEHSTE